MDEESGRRLSNALLISALALGGLWAYSYFTSSSMPESPQAEGPAEPAQTPTTRVAAPSCRDRQSEERLVTIETEHFRAQVSNLNGGIKSFVLTNERYLNEDGSPLELVTTDRCDYYPFRAELEGIPIPADASWSLEALSERAVQLRWSGQGYQVERTLRAGDAPYQLWSSVTVVNESGQPRGYRVVEHTNHYVKRDDEGGGFFATRSHKIGNAICRWGEDETTRMDREAALPKEPYPSGHGFGPPVLFTGVENAFFANVLSAGEGRAWRCRLRTEDRPSSEEPDGSLFQASLVYEWLELPPGERSTHETMAYLGPKDHDALVAAGHQLTEVVDLGWFAIVARWLVALLRTIYGIVGNWGLAIIAMTVLVRIVLFPLTWKSFQSMARMRVLKPEMDRINELYSDDRERKGAAIMELYRKHKINPLGGCLPQLLQMPIWFAFYASLSTNVELYRAEFALWWTDLSAPDPYYALPLLLGGLMHFQQRITPAAMDPAQQKMMMYMMPVMITVFMLFLPAGLCLYMATNSVLGIIQQQWIHRRLDAQSSSAAQNNSDGGAEQREEAAPGNDPSPDPKGRTARNAGNGPEPDTGAGEDLAGVGKIASSDAQSVVNRMKSRSKRKAVKRRTRRARS